MNFLKLLASALFAFSHVGGFAQTLSQIKPTDKISMEYRKYVERGRELVVSSTTPRSPTIEITAEGRTIDFKNGYLEKYNNDLVLIETSQRGAVRKVEEKYLFRWMNPDTASRETYAVDELFRNPQLGIELKNEWKFAPADGKFKLLIGGRVVEVKVLEYRGTGVLQDGAGRFSSKMRIVYSPELNMVLEREFLQYSPDSFLNVGNGWKVLAIN